MVEAEGLAPPEWLDVNQLPWLLARIFHTRIGFSPFFGKRYESDGFPAGFSPWARVGGVARGKTPFFGGAHRRSANSARAARRFLVGVPRGYPSAAVSCISRA